MEHTGLPHDHGEEQNHTAAMRELRDTIPAAAAVGYVTEKQDNWIILE